MIPSVITDLGQDNTDTSIVFIYQLGSAGSGNVNNLLCNKIRLEDELETPNLLVKYDRTSSYSGIFGIKCNIQ